MNLHYREKKLENLGFPREYIDIYLYTLTKDTSYLSEEYFIQYPTKRVVNAGLLRKTKEELLLLFGRLIIFNDLIDGDVFEKE